MFRIALMASLLAAPAFAQDSAATLAKKILLGTPMGEAEFRAMTDGNTITYNNQGDDLYREYYRPGTNRVVIEWTTPSADGQINCDIGSWRAEDGNICFDWSRSGSVCSAWVDYQGEYISELVIDGERRGNIEPISEITATPLYCEVGMVSLSAPISPAG
ncbi:MAG TPA: hypothetical protein EYG79_02950 [Rhodobacteraceae bacterium]|nr:hypothetical protein [Paracoccaceae bacterium]